MPARKVLVYYAWSRPAETGAPLGTIENRFPTLFESRRLGYPHYEDLSDAESFDQGIAGFLDHIMKRNFTGFVELAAALTGEPVVQIERVDQDGRLTMLDASVLDGIDTLIVISFDSLRSAQHAQSAEIEAVRHFLDERDHLAFVCPHHDIGDTGDVPDLPHDERLKLQLADFLHHGDRSIPPQQGFSGFARSLLAGLGVPVLNRYGLRPAIEADGTPTPIEYDRTLDRLGLLEGVETFNLHPHLPHLERMGDAIAKLDVLARQTIDRSAPPHPFAQEHLQFDALLQSREDTFAGNLFVSDATLWSSTAGGTENLRRIWTHVVQRVHRG